MDAEQPADSGVSGSGRMRFEPGDYRCGRVPRRVCRGESLPLVETFKLAQEQAARVRAEFARAGFGAELSVTPCLDEHAGPCVLLVLTRPGRPPVWVVFTADAPPLVARVRGRGHAA